jgi:3-hydroxyacyl-[acyl-carrier-protein] dehydratase
MLDLNEIKKIIPHREPFILIDRVLSNEPLVTTTAEKHILTTEFWVPGHFPGRPIFPGVLMIEALAQTGAICILTAPAYLGRMGYFSSIQEAKFKRLVVPGDILKLQVKYLNMKAGFFFFEGEAWVGEQIVCSAKFSVVVG